MGKPDRKYMRLKLGKIGMICFAKRGRTEDLYIVRKETFSITGYMCDTYT
jgi:hypothetical protein